MKIKFISFIIIIAGILSQSCIIANADREQSATDKIKTLILDEEHDSEYVTRQDCLIAIMKMIGVDEQCAMVAGTQTYYSIYPFGLWGFDAGYIRMAHDAHIAEGIGNNEFLPDRNATEKECLAFMLRCLNERENVEWDNTFSDSLRAGLLTQEEYDLTYEKKLLSYDFFEVLLYRFGNMKIYKYCDFSSTLNTDIVTPKDNTDVKYIDRLSWEKLKTFFEAHFAEIKAGQSDRGWSYERVLNKYGKGKNEEGCLVYSLDDGREIVIWFAQDEQVLCVETRQGDEYSISEIWEAEERSFDDDPALANRHLISEFDFIKPGMDFEEVRQRLGDGYVLTGKNPQKVRYLTDDFKWVTIYIGEDNIVQSTLLSSNT